MNDTAKTITTDNYESYLLRYAEGDLDERQCAEVEAFLALHPALQEELADYMDAPRLPKPSQTESYPRQRELHRIGVGRPVVWWHMCGAVAACLVLALVVGRLWRQTPQLPTARVQVATIATPDSTPVKPLAMQLAMEAKPVAKSTARPTQPTQPRLQQPLMQEEVVDEMTLEQPTVEEAKPEVPALIVVENNSLVLFVDEEEEYEESGDAVVQLAAAQQETEIQVPQNFAERIRTLSAQRIEAVANRWGNALQKGWQDWQEADLQGKQAQLHDGYEIAQAGIASFMQRYIIGE